MDHDVFYVIGITSGCRLIGDCKDLILSWKYGHISRLFVLSRDDGIQYFRCSFKDLSSLRYYELFRLGGLDKINRSRESEHANQMARILNQEVRSKNFVLFNPTYGKRKTYKKEINPRTNLPQVETIYPPVRSLKQIPLFACPQDCLGNFKRWRFSSKTREAIITDNDKGDILFIHDPMQLVTLSKSDLQILSQNRILTIDNERHPTYTFEHVVYICVQKGYHSGNLPLKN